MTAVAAFEVLTDEDPEVVKSNLIKLWIWKVVKIVLDPQSKSTVYILEYIFYKPENDNYFV